MCFTIATQTVAAGLFTLVGAAQMAQWAIGKHARLRKVGRVLGPGCGGGGVGQPAAQLAPAAGQLSTAHPPASPPGPSLQTFDGREGREKYPRRWIMLPPFF